MRVPGEDFSMSSDYIFAARVAFGKSLGRGLQPLWLLSHAAIC
jgi:hypothetical protein